MEPNALAADRSRYQIVDVRYPNEWDAGHVEGARHIPQDDLAERVGELDRNRPVGTVCRSGSRSADAAASLRDEGFDAQNLEGGMEAWAEAGLPFTASDGSTGRVAEPEPPPDDRPEEVQRLQGKFLEAIFAVQEHFGDREPSEDELKAFLRDKLVAEGHSPEEAERFLEEGGTA
jgi:rhodanese-related sulfurtransferase